MTFSLLNTCALLNDMDLTFSLQLHWQDLAEEGVKGHSDPDKHYRKTYNPEKWQKFLTSVNIEKRSADCGWQCSVCSDNLCVLVHFQFFTVNTLFLKLLYGHILNKEKGFCCFFCLCFILFFLHKVKLHKGLFCVEMLHYNLNRSWTSLSQRKQTLLCSLSCTWCVGIHATPYCYECAEKHRTAISVKSRLTVISSITHTVMCKCTRPSPRSVNLFICSQKLLLMGQKTGRCRGSTTTCLSLDETIVAVKIATYLQ